MPGRDGLLLDRAENSRDLGITSVLAGSSHETLSRNYFNKALEADGILPAQRQRTSRNRGVLVNTIYCCIFHSIQRRQSRKRGTRKSRFRADPVLAESVSGNNLENRAKKHQEVRTRILGLNCERGKPVSGLAGAPAG